jgi:hypothetical protein
MRRCDRLALVLLLLLLLGLAVAGAVPNVVSGRVREANDPVAGAVVRFQGTGVCTHTNADGQFRLPSRRDRRVTAWKEGHLIVGAALNSPFLDLRLQPLPTEDHDEYEWVDPAPDAARPQNCANCHAEIYREWAGSGHARAATGRRFRNLYEGTDANGKAGVGWGLLAQHPLGADVCTSCHAPTAHDLGDLRGVDRRGVHCDYCHKIAGIGDGTIGLSHGRFNLTLLRPAPGHQLFFGPLDDVDRGEDAYSPLYRDSRYCASCHEGVVFGVHVYSTYSEWLDSPARRQGLQCQDCHMKPTGRMRNIAPGHGGIDRDPRSLGNHRFFDDSLRDMLRRCLQVEAEIRRDGVSVRAEVRVRAEGVGHRVPTGYIDRHLILIAEGLDDKGRTLQPLQCDSFLPDAVGVELAGRPGRLYARLLRDEKGHQPAPFWHQDGEEPIDTRLKPGEVDRLRLRYPATLNRLRVRVIYRLFWEEVARTKGWPERDWTILDRTFSFSAPP